MSGQSERYDVWEAPEAPDPMQRIEDLEIAIRTALSFVQERFPDHADGHAVMVIAALRGALRNTTTS